MIRSYEIRITLPHFVARIRNIGAVGWCIVLVLGLSMDQVFQFETTSSSINAFFKIKSGTSESTATTVDAKLPPLSWPLKDQTISKAIQNAHRISIDQTPTVDGKYYLWNSSRYESPPEGLATLVTAYYDIKSKHPREQYEAWIKNLLTATDPMVIFIDPTSTYYNWKPFMQERRQHAPTLLVALPFANFTMSTTFSDDFWYTYIFPRDMAKRFKKNADVYKIWNEKIIMMKEVARMNPFDTGFFFWIDAGYFRRTTPNQAPIVRNNISNSGVADHQVVYQRVGDYPSYEIAGGAWGGTANAISINFHRYWQTFWYLTMYSDKECVGFEQRVQVWMCRSFPDVCVVNHSRNWFDMGTNWLRSTNFRFLDGHQDIPYNRTTDIPLVNASMVTFPSESVVQRIPQIPAGSLSLQRHLNYTQT